MIKLAVFDLDGTLLDTVPDLTSAMSSAMIRMGRPAISREQTRAYIGNGIRKYAERSLGAGASEDDITEAVAYFKEYYSEHLTDNTEPYDGIYDVIRSVKNAGLKCAVLSNKYDAATNYIINAFFPDVFDYVLGEGENCKRKPDPQGFTHLCELCGCECGQAVMIGDSASDLDVAANTGAAHIIVTWGYRTRETMEARGAKVFAETPEELSKLILSL